MSLRSVRRGTRARSFTTRATSTVFSAAHRSMRIETPRGETMDRIVKLVEKGIQIAKTFDWLALLVARLTVGVLFVSTGWGKVNNLAKVTEFFVELKIP